MTSPDQSFTGEWCVVKDEGVRRKTTLRTNHKPGQVVMVGIEHVHRLPEQRHNAEFVWVKLDKVKDGDKLAGKLLNDPSIPGIGLKKGEKIEFSNRDVIEGRVATD